ncbi:MAG: NTP transferase domain-containing protein [Anaerolineales bacterium]|nr:NTP transferase domain-containing protein [Anaerolineales bacterium]MCB0011805.1 NTP transferase domain-containing protein [Anaerolineales bacterium]
MDAIVLAGGRTKPEDPMYAYIGDKPKSLTPMGGRTMVEWVVSALQGAEGVDDVVVVGLTEALLPAGGLNFDRPVTFLPDQNNVVKNVFTSVEHLQQVKPAQDTYLLVSADIPLIKPEMVDYFIDACRPYSGVLYYAVVTDAVMEKRFPGSKRSYVRFTEANVAGGDIYVFKSALLQKNEEFWNAFVDARKNALRLARTLGFSFLIKLLLRRLSLAELERTGLRIFGEPIKVVQVRYAELGMDADKPHQIDLVRAELEHSGA